nr:hypothetical protein [uncultured Roseococcus sp.]
MPDKYNVDSYSVPNLTERLVMADVFRHMHAVFEDGTFRKFTKRRAVSQAVYAVAKHFGHRTAFYDLYLDHASRVPDLLNNQVDKVFRVPTEGVQLSWFLTVLGGETKKKSASASVTTRLDANAIMANQIEIKSWGTRRVFVMMELSGQAFINLCCDYGKRALARQFRDKLVQKWGNLGTTYGIYRAHGSDAGDEGYRFVRYVDDVPKVYTEGFGWQNMTLSHDDMRR